MTGHQGQKISLPSKISAQSAFNSALKKGEVTQHACGTPEPTGHSMKNPVEELKISGDRKFNGVKRKKLTSKYC
jgi:hypothetical protein